MAKEDVKKWVFDLTALDNVDSSDLGMFVTFNATVSNLDGSGDRRQRGYGASAPRKVPGRSTTG